MDYLGRQKQIREQLTHILEVLNGTPLDRVDYETMARQISHVVGVPVVVFPAPSNGENGAWKLVAYEIPQVSQ